MRRWTLGSLVGLSLMASCKVDLPEYNVGCPEGYLDNGSRCVPEGGAGGSAGTQGGGGESEGGHATGGHSAGGDAGAPPENGGAGGGSEAGGSEAGGSPGTGGGSGDSTAPTVVSVSPEDGAVGVTEDAVITVSFSEPMAPATVIAAYHSDALPPNQVEFEWRNENQILDIVPRSPLEYAEGTAPQSTVAQTYDITIGDSATDEAGNALESALEVGFATLRRIENFVIEPSAVQPTNSDRDSTLCVFDGSDDRRIGYILHSYEGYRNHAMTAAFPLPENVQIEAGELTTGSGGTFRGDPFGTLGDLVLAQLPGTTIPENSYHTAPAALLGAYGEADHPHFDFAGADLSNPAAVVILRLQFPENTEQSGESRFEYICSNVQLRLTYLVE